ncbi:MAG TPA: hypothetical protein VG604_05105 [Candidatus Saccharimonadales bacterium]|nr:hypothetical protein [Candidatus Saccharimonadales bacterium]
MPEFDERTLACYEAERILTADQAALADCQSEEDTNDFLNNRLEEYRGVNMWLGAAGCSRQLFASGKDISSACYISDCPLKLTKA